MDPDFTSRVVPATARLGASDFRVGEVCAVRGCSKDYLWM